MKKSEKYSNKMSQIYEKTHPSRSILKLAGHFLIYNWSFSLITIIMLIFAAEFAHNYGIRFGNSQVSSSEVVTSLSLSLLVNTIIYAFLIGISSASSTFFLRRMGNNNHRDHEKWFGTLFLLYSITIVLLIIFAIWGARYIVYLQNLHLPNNYRQIVVNILYCFAVTIPFLAICVVYSSHLSAEGNPWIFSFSGILPITFFIFFSWIFYDTNALSFIHNPGLRITYILGSSFFLSYMLTALGLIGIGIWLRFKNVTFFLFHPRYIKNARWYISKILLANSAPIFFRIFSVIVAIIIINIMLNYIAIPAGSTQPGNEHSSGKLPSSSIYWQFITSAISPIFSFVLRGMFAIGSGSSRYILSYNMMRKNYKQLLLTLKWAFIYVMSYLCIMELIIMAAAPGLLSLFGVRNGAHYNFVNNAGNIETIIAPFIANQGKIITRIVFASLFLITAQPVVAAFAISSKRKLLAYFCFSFDKFLLNVPLFLLFTWIASKTGTYYVAWISYNVSDLLAFIVIMWILLRVREMIHVRKNKVIKEIGVVANEGK